MSYILDYRNWNSLFEQEASTGSLMPDVLAGAQFNKWSASKVKPGFVLFPSWELSRAKESWWIPIDSYSFKKSKNAKGEMIVANRYSEILDIFLPAGHPSAKNNSDQILGDGTEVNTYNYEGNPAPTEPTLNAIAQKYPTTDDGQKWIPKNSVGVLGPNAVLTRAPQNAVDAFFAYELMRDKQPTLSPDDFLMLLDSAMPGAKMLLVNQIKSGMMVAGGKLSDMKMAAELVAKVKSLPEFTQNPTKA